MRYISGLIIGDNVYRTFFSPPPHFFNTHAHFQKQQNMLKSLFRESCGDVTIMAMGYFSTCECLTIFLTYLLLRFSIHVLIVVPCLSLLRFSYLLRHLTIFYGIIKYILKCYMKCRTLEHLASNLYPNPWVSA